MSREARGAALVLALLGVVTLLLWVRRRADDALPPPAPTYDALATAPSGDAPSGDAPSGDAPTTATADAPRPPEVDASPQGVAPPPSAPARAGLTLRGRVVDPAGRPVAGARVVCGAAQPRSVESAPDGGFTLDHIPPGDLGPRFARVDLEVQGDRARAARHGLVVGPDTPQVEVVLRPTTWLRVRVLSSGARVVLRAVLHAEGLRPRVEQAAGQLDLECHDGDWVDVMAVAPGHAPRRFALRAPSPEVVVQLSRVGGGALRGRVVEHDGAPANPVRLCVASSADDPLAATGPGVAGTVEERPLGCITGVGTTRGDGSFTIDGLAEGARVRLEARREVERADLAAALSGQPGLTVDATVGDDELLITLPPPDAHRVRLRAVAAESGQPLPEVELGPGWAREPGGAPGAFGIDLPGPGARELVLRASGRLSRVLRVTLDRAETRDLGDVPLDLPGALRLTVRWPDAPVEAAWLTWTDARGEPGRGDCRRTGEPVEVACAPGARTYTLRAQRPDGRRQVVTFGATVVAGQTTPVEVDLTSAPLLERE